VAWVVGLALVLSGIAFAGEGEGEGKKKEKGKARGNMEKVEFVSAAVADGKVTLKVKDKTGAEKAMEMPAEVAVISMERKGEKIVLSIQPKGDKVPESKAKHTVTVGTITKAELADGSVTLTLKSGEGEKAAESASKIPAIWMVAASEADGKTTVSEIKIPGLGKEGHGKKGKDKKAEEQK
jgi:hypothetical protein